MKDAAMKTLKNRDHVRGTVNDHHVAAAMARSSIRRRIHGLSVELFLMGDGERAAGLLSRLAWVVGMGMEISLRERTAAPLAEELSAALRIVLRLSIDGGRWRADQADRLWVAIHQVCALMLRHPAAAVAAQKEAASLAECVRAVSCRSAGASRSAPYRRTAH